MIVHVITQAIKKTVMAFSVQRAFSEAMIRFDFKLGNQRQNTMQICFANLAAWPLVAALAVLIFVSQFFPLQFLSLFLGDESQIRFALLHSSLINMGITFVLMFAIHWFVRQENIGILGFMFLVCAGELHIALALSGLFAVYFTRIFYVWKAGLQLHGKVRSVSHYVAFWNFVAWAFAFSLGLFWLHQLLASHMFQSGTWLTRPLFLLTMVALYYFLSHMLLSIWGHFYFRKLEDPTELHVQYSTSEWIGRHFGPRHTLKVELKELALKTKDRHERHLQEFKELSREHQGLNVLPIEKVITQEITYLTKALKHLDSV